MKRTSMAALALLGAATLAGCRGTTAAGTPYSMQIDRALATYLGTDLTTAHLLAQDVIENQMLYAITHESLDGRAGVIEADTAEGKPVRVETYWAGNRVTKIEVLVGTFGDEGAQLAIVNALQDQIRMAVAE